jgi:hypothetical protein
MTNDEKNPETRAETAEPHLLRPWLTLDRWTRDEAMLLLSGSEPDGTTVGYVPNYGGFTYDDFTKGYGCFLDGSPTYDDHPRREQSIEDFAKVLLIMRNIDADERRSPAEWLAYAKRNGFVPHWLKWAQEQGLIEADLVSICPVNSAKAVTDLNVTDDDDKPDVPPPDALAQDVVLWAVKRIYPDPHKLPNPKRGPGAPKAIREFLKKHMPTFKRDVSSALARLKEAGKVDYTEKG